MKKIFLTSLALLFLFNCEQPYASLTTNDEKTEIIKTLFEKVSEEQSSQTLNTSYDSGFRYYDTAPWYGHGLSEHRIGSLLRNKLREEYIISSKVGRVYKPFKEDYKKI